MTPTEQYRVLETEAEAKEKELGQLEETLVALEKKLAALEKELARRQEAAALKAREDSMLLAPAPPQEAERTRLEILRQLGWVPELYTLAPAVAPEAPARITLGEMIISPEWWKQNWPWLGVGTVGLITIAILAKGGRAK